MTCEQCAALAKHNRKIFDQGLHRGQMLNHKQCGCTCQHKLPTQWEDMFSVGRPNEEASTDQN